MPRFEQALRVEHCEEVGVLGYHGHTLCAVKNISGRPIRCTLVLGHKDRRPLQLDDDERYELGLDITPCIKRRFVPYVETNETINLAVEWDLVAGPI